MFVGSRCEGFSTAWLKQEEKEGREEKREGGRERDEERESPAKKKKISFLESMFPCSCHVLV